MRQRQHSGKSPSSVPFRACLSTDPHYSIDSRSRQSDLSLSLRFPVLGKHGGGLGQRARLLREEWCVSQLAKTPDSRCKCACRKRRGDIPSSPSFSILPSSASFPVCLSIANLLHIMRIRLNGRGKMSHRLKRHCCRRHRHRHRGRRCRHLLLHSIWFAARLVPGVFGASSVPSESGGR